MSAKVSNFIGAITSEQGSLTSTSGKVNKGLIAQFSSIIEEKLDSAENSNAEAALSVQSLLDSNESDLLSKIESLSDIESILKQVTKLLGLDSSDEKTLVKADPENIPDELVAQLADFLAGLKNIANTLKQSFEAGESAEINGSVISGDELKEVSDRLNQLSLQLEIDFNKLEISPKITAELAKIQKEVKSNGGMMVAQNPKELAKKQQIPQTLKDLLSQEEDELEGFIQKIRVLANKNKKSGAEALKSLKNDTETKNVLTGKPLEKTETSLLDDTLDGNADSEQNQHNNEKSSSNDSEQKESLSELLKEGSTKAEKSSNIVDVKNSNIDAEGNNLTTNNNDIEFAQKLSEASKTSKLPTSAKTFEQMVMNQISDKVVDAAKDGVKEVSLILKPKSLGEIKVHLQLDGDIVVAKLQVESQQVRQIIETNLQALRDALSEQNLKAGSLDVNVGHGDGRGEKSDGKKKRRTTFFGQEDDEGLFVEDMLGQETGKRYGNNSMEYFA